MAAPTAGDERHRVTVSGIVDLPLGFQFSTLTTLGSGQAYQVVDNTNSSSAGFATFTARYPEKNCIKGVFAFCEVNLMLANKIKPFGRDDHELELAIDVLNAFNNKNFEGFDGGFSNQPDPNNPGQVIDPLEPANAANASSLLTCRGASSSASATVSKGRFSRGSASTRRRCRASRG
ncbi:hypothetical protein AB5I41_24040 [Sphingomonas sp. MMS24-JH45]